MILRKHGNTLNILFSSLMIVCVLFSVPSVVTGADSCFAPLETFSSVEAKKEEAELDEDASNDSVVSDPFTESYTIELDNLTATFNQSAYRPGTGVNVSIKAREDRLHADLEYELHSPADEVAFKIGRPVEIVFQDPNFDNENVTEWDNDTINGFDNITIYNGKLLLTLNGTGNAIVSFNDTSLNGTYRVKFTYQNATRINETLSNETLKFYYWNGDEFSQEALNYSTGSEIQFDKILYLNITSNPSPNGILFAFVLNSSQDTVKNWTIDNLYIENYNYEIFQDPGFDDNIIRDWFNGTNTFNETKIVKEGDESYLALTHYVGKGVLFYNLTSLTGDSIIEFDYRNTTINASQLEFEYWNGSHWISAFLNRTESSAWNHHVLLVALNGWNKNESYSLLRFTINATAASTWNIDNIRVTPLNDPGYVLPVPDLGLKYRSTKTSTWTHEGVNNTISVVSDVFRNGTEPVLLNITFNLPSKKIILGNWTFKIIPKQSPSDPTLPNPVELEFKVTSDIDFIKSTAFARRGNFNTTEPGIIEEPYLTSPEAVFSPGEEIYFIGQLNMTWTKELLWANYTEIGTFQKSVEPTYENVISPIWSSNATSINMSLVEWELGLLKAYDPEAGNFVDGNFTAATGGSEYNDTSYFMLHIKIPNRGIYGKANNSLIVKFLENEPRGASIKIPIELNIKYFVNITRETNVTDLDFPEQIQLSSWIDGNLTIQPISWNASPSVGLSWNASYANYSEITETNETLRLVNVTDILNISLDDIHFDILLNSTDLETHPFQIRRVNNTIYWSGKLDPNLPTGNYTIRLIWTDPSVANESIWGVLNWAIKGNLRVHRVPIELFGTLILTAISENRVVIQGETLSIFFSIIYQENNASVSGLRLYANTSRSGNKIFVIESNDRYSLDFSAGIDEIEGPVTIYIFKEQTNEEIGQIAIDVEHRKIKSADLKESPLALPIALAFAAIILACFGYIGRKILR